MSFYSDAAKFIVGEEGFRAKPYWDVNHYRIGYGSDTLTLPNGTYRSVTVNDVTTKALADKDLERRIKAYEDGIKNKVGTANYNKLSDNAKISLLSIAYNYGSITKQQIVDAVKTGDEKKIAQAIIDSTANDNSRLTQKVRDQLKERRAREADFILAAIDYAKKYKWQIGISIGVAALGLYLIVKNRKG